MAQHGRQIMQAVILILEGEHSPDVKEQALCILANIADGETAKEFIMSNEDVLRKLTNYMVSGLSQHRKVKAQFINKDLLCPLPLTVAFERETADGRYVLHR